MKIGNRILLGMALLSSFAVDVFAGGAGYDCGGRSLKVFGLLLTLALGYWILTVAFKQKKPLDLIGKIVGGLILIISLGGLICTAVYGYCKWKGSCSIESKSACTYKAPAEVPAD